MVYSLKYPIVTRCKSQSRQENSIYRSLLQLTDDWIFNKLLFKCQQRIETTNKSIENIKLYLDETISQINLIYSAHFLFILCLETISGPISKIVSVQFMYLQEYGWGFYLLWLTVIFKIFRVRDPINLFDFVDWNLSPCMN